MTSNPLMVSRPFKVLNPPNQKAKPLILIVDDEPQLCGLLDLYFSHKGLAMHSALTMEQGRSALEHTKFGLVIVDWNLGGTDGLELVALSKALQPATPVIVYTGVAGVGLRELAEALQGRADAVLHKTSSLDKLCGEVFRLLGR